MICSICGGQVEWKGPFSNLTHTECLSCGSINSQVVEEAREQDDGDEEAEASNG